MERTTGSGWKAAALAAAAIGCMSVAQDDGPGELDPCGRRLEEPCPALVDRRCDQDGAAIPCGCACGEGWWSRRMVSSAALPSVPWDTGPQSSTFNLTTWRWNGSAAAYAGHAEASFELTGFSTLWHAGSLTKSASASHSSVEREEWSGTGAPCPRLVHVAAMGGAVIELSLTCSATPGTAASGSVSVAGACRGPGNASAQLESKTVNGTAAYSQSSHKVTAEGKLGTSIDDDGFGIDGRISRLVDWKLEGAGVVTGSAAYVVMPDRTYCAFTNRAVTLRSSGSVAVSIGATVDDNGAAGVTAYGLVSLRVV